MAKSSDTPPLDPDRQCVLDEILGNDAMRAHLRSSIAESRLPRSILFTGPPGVGKRTLAWALAKDILQGGPASPDSKLARRVARASHPDAMGEQDLRRMKDADGQVAKPSASGQIVVDDIRKADDWVSRSPVEGDRKALILAGAERMNPSAANALLKLLEEPPDHLVIVLTTSDPANLLPTIRSRCTILPLEGVPAEILSQWVRRKLPSVAGARADLAAEMAEGRPGLALALARGRMLERRADLLRDLRMLREQGFTVVFGVADRIGSMNEDLEATLENVLVLLRDALTLAIGAGRPVNRDLTEDLALLAKGTPAAALLAAATRVERAVGRTGYFLGAARTHFLETLVIDMGRALRRGE